MHEAFHVIRTWVNSWSTSTRYHEDPVPPCLFGCVNLPDSLQHYLACAPMNRIVDSHILRYRPTHPLNRLGLHIPSKEGFLELAATFHAYHAVKLGLGFNPHKLDFVKNHCIFSQAFVAACEAASLPVEFGLLTLIVVKLLSLVPFGLALAPGLPLPPLLWRDFRTLAYCTSDTSCWYCTL